MSGIVAIVTGGSSGIGCSTAAALRDRGCIVHAFTVSDHSMGSRFKMYGDRNFCNGTAP